MSNSDTENNDDDPILSLEELTRIAATTQFSTFTTDVKCCCGAETCTFLAQNREVLRELEGRNHSAGRLGTVTPPISSSSCHLPPNPSPRNSSNTMVIK